MSVSKLSVSKLSVIMLSAVMLRVMEPCFSYVNIIMPFPFVTDSPGKPDLKGLPFTITH